MNTLSTLGLSFGIQNVRSLNISTKNELTTQKIIAICSLKNDFIFLSDLRLNSTKQIAAVNDLDKQFSFNGYKLIHNSCTSSRGVGILVKKQTYEKLTILRIIRSEDSNFIILHVLIKNVYAALCAIYGPNRDGEIVFFDNLKNALRGFTCPIICGGDWNATYDASPVNANLDVVNMRNLPSLLRTNKILDMCNELNLLEPYRTLFPNKTEYTFIPSGINDTNRSRLDFFLMSNAILGTGTGVRIPNGLLTTLFDHKSVQLYLNFKKPTRKNLIKDTILTNVDLPAYVKAAVFECYLQHYDPDPNDANRVRDDTINEYLLGIGRIMSLLSEIRDTEIKMAVEGYNNLYELQIEGKRGEISLIFDDLPDLEFFENLRNSHQPSVFFQTLACCIKNNVMAHQSTVFKLSKENKLRLNKKISVLKENFEQNKQEILITERLLSETTEKELRDELMHYKKFESLNNEKITRQFMNLVRVSNSGESVEEIKKDDGSEFFSDEERGQYIHDYYKNIYRQPNNRSKNVDVADIDNFLGPIRFNATVNNARLTDAEKNDLETEINLEELTKSINESNQSSAPGADGISNRFIKHFWNYFKTPMLRLTQDCMVRNELPDFFLSAHIKLIPKKGDLSKIKNWRPISLLNCFYKIVSRVITSRLRKYMDKMTPICQKGYSGTRYCQEVLIQVIEGIEKCKVNRIKGAVISLDIKKAFDSLSHSYLQSVYKFYNFGPNIIKWITLLSTKRKACIMLNGDKTTALFDLERGNAQGDTISPFLFNLGYQLLLFKLDLNFQIEGTQTETVGSVVPGGAGQGFQAAPGAAAAADQAAAEPANNRVEITEVRNPDPKVSAMADDCTLLIKLNTDNLNVIISILTEFEEISGLGCNLEKTSLMPVGVIEPLPQEILDLGLSINTEITLLGAKIKSNGLCFDENGGIILEKVRKQVNFWRRFNLSLPGRISISKTFLYSQINYLGCFLPLGDENLNRLSEEIERFVRGNLKIGKQKIYDDVSNGGLGMFKVRDYLSAQCCAWIKRSSNLDELWKHELNFFSNGSVFNLRKKNFDARKNPILHHIAGCFEKFIFKFTAIRENFMKMWIFENPSLVFDQNMPNFLNRDFFTEPYFEQNKQAICNITMDKILNMDKSFKSKQIFEQLTGIEISDVKYDRLVGLARTAIANYGGGGSQMIRF